MHFHTYQLRGWVEAEGDGQNRVIMDDLFVVVRLLAVLEWGLGLLQLSQRCNTGDEPSLASICHQPLRHVSLDVIASGIATIYRVNPLLPQKAQGVLNASWR